MIQEIQVETEMCHYPIVIPTYKRIHNQQTWASIHPDLRKHIIFVVRPEEANEIAALYAPSSVDILPDTVKDIMGTRQYIWDKYSKLHDYFFQLDDDIRRFYHLPVNTVQKPKFKCDMIGGKTAGQKPTPDAQIAMFNRCLDELKTGTGMTSPRPNWGFPPDVGPNYPVTKNVLVTGFYAFNCRVLVDKNIRFDRWASCGDTDACMQVLGHGIQTTYCADYSYWIEPMLGTSQLRANVVNDHKEMAERYTGYMKPRNTDKSGELGVLASYTYLRKKLFSEAPFKK